MVDRTGMFYDGKPIDDLTKDELINALIEAYAMWRKSKMALEKTLELLAKKKGEEDTLQGCEYDESTGGK